MADCWADLTRKSSQYWTRDPLRDQYIWRMKESFLLEECDAQKTKRKVARQFSWRVWGL